MNSNPLVITVKGLRKSYQMGHGQVDALRHIDLEVQRGEMVAIMGPSGSGKSTLMHLLGCLDKPSSGTYLLSGQDISQLDDASLSLIRATQIGFIFQSFNLIPQLNVIENIQLPFLYHTLPDLQEETILNSISRVGLSHRLYHLPTELSGGEMQRVAIARALAIDPLLILADEPTGNLDYETSCSILALFQSLHAQGATIIIVTHDEFVAKHCRRLIRMRDGLIVHDGSVS